MLSRFILTITRHLSVKVFTYFRTKTLKVIYRLQVSYCVLYFAAYDFLKEENATIFAIFQMRYVFFDIFFHLKKIQALQICNHISSRV